MKELIALMLVLLPTAAAGQVNKFAAFHELYVNELKVAGVVGSSFIFLKEGKVVSEIHYGSLNAATNQAVNADTIYHWASNTKPFTGIAIMQLRDRGLLNLDDPVTKYLPELRGVYNKFGSMEELTIRHLMTHSAGFRNPTWPWDRGEEWEPFEPTEYSQLVAMFPFTEILFKPGSKFSYSNPGIIFLGRIIEKLSGEDYEVYVDKNILRPLEMYRSYFDATPNHLLKYRSHSYYVENGKRKEARFDVNTGITVSNSGLNSPIADMMKYLNFLVGDVKKQADHEGMLKRSSLEEMWKPQLRAEIDANGNRGFTTGIGLIFFINKVGDRAFLGHGGDQNGFISYIDFEPTSRQASILVLNTDVSYPSGIPAHNRVVHRLRTAIAGLY